MTEWAEDTAKSTVKFIKDRLHGCPFEAITTRMAEIEISSALREAARRQRERDAETVLSFKSSEHHFELWAESISKFS